MLYYSHGFEMLYASNDGFAKMGKLSTEQSSKFNFEPAGLLFGKLRLNCISACSLEGTVLALVQGITVSSCVTAQAFAPGDLFDLPIHYFPNVILPTKIRVVINDVEVAAPFSVTAPEDVMPALGPGEISVDNIFLDNGLLRGTIVNATNGVHIPSAFVKINSQVVRSVVVEPLKLRDSGGTTCRFAVPIRPNDFVESGLHVELFIAGLDYSIANFAYTRDNALAGASRLIELDEKVRQLQKSTLLQVEMLSNSVERRFNIQLERLDTFIEYTISLVLDHLTRGNLAEAGPLIETIRKLRGVMLADSTLSAVSAKASSARIPLDSAAYAFGWYDVEMNESGYFRWMGQAALIRHPYVNLPVHMVKITVSQVYGAHEPMLRASLNDQEFVTKVEKQGKSFTVTLTAPNDQPLLGEALLIECFATGSPAADHGTTDSRVLSLSATEVIVFYEAKKD